MRYFLCKRCGITFSEKELDEAGHKCPKCLAEFDVDNLSGAWMEMTEEM